MTWRRPLVLISVAAKNGDRYIEDTGKFQHLLTEFRWWQSSGEVWRAVTFPQNGTYSKRFHSSRTCIRLKYWLYFTRFHKITLMISQRIYYHIIFLWHMCFSYLPPHLFVLRYIGFMFCPRSDGRIWLLEKEIHTCAHSLHWKLVSAASGMSSWYIYYPNVFSSFLFPPYLWKRIILTNLIRN